MGCYKHCTKWNKYGRRMRWCCSGSVSRKTLVVLVRDLMLDQNDVGIRFELNITMKFYVERIER